MTIIKARVQENFCIIPNATSQDEALSFEATGLLVFLLSLPQDWEIHKIWIQKQKIKCGRDKVSNMLRELEDAGYVRKTQSRSTSGSFESNDYLVYPTAGDWKPVDGESVNGKPATTKNTSIQSKQDTNTNSVIDDLFEQFWLAGLPKVNKKKALTVWRSVLKKQSNDPTSFTIMIAMDIKMRLEAKQFGFDKLHPERYLKNERWTDDIVTDSLSNQSPDLSSTNWAGDKVFDPTYLES